MSRAEAESAEGAGAPGAADGHARPPSRRAADNGGAGRLRHLWRAHVARLLAFGLAAALIAAAAVLVTPSLAPVPSIQATPIAPTAREAPAEAQDVHAPLRPAEAAAEVSPQSVSDPAAELAALSAPATEARVERPGVLIYHVQAGDTLHLLAERFGLRAETLVWANDVPNWDLILIGQPLRIPPVDGVHYTVRPGDTLSTIALRFGLEVASVARTNGLADPDRLVVGTELWLPGGRPLAAPSAAPPTVAEPLLEAAAADLAPLPDRLGDILGAGWLRTTAETALYRSAERGARVLHTLPRSARLERAGGLEGRRVLVRDPGDGQTRQAMTGWVDVAALEPGLAPPPRELPLGYPDDTRMDIAHVFVPYRNQLDGSPWAAANCGPTALSMVLAAFGIDASPGQLRREVLAAQGIYGNHVGTLLTALARVGEQRGLRIFDLYEGGRIKRWDLDDLRGHVQAGHPVLVQVSFRRLPGNERVPYYADHYIVITGVVDDAFLYNDPLGLGGPGWDRLISGQRLLRAMEAGDRRYQYAAFAAARG